MDASSLLDRLAADSTGLSAAVCAAVRQEMGDAAVRLSEETEQVIGYLLPLVLQAARTDRGLSRRELEPLRESAARVAALGIPLDVLLRGVSVAASTLMTALWELATPRERMQIPLLIARGLRMARQISTAAHDGHRVRGVHDHEPCGREGQRQMVKGLLTASPVTHLEHLARRCGHRLAPPYLVLAVLFAKHHAGAGGGRVGERSPRDARTLVALGDDGGIVLVGMGGEDVEDARRLAAAAATSVGTGREYVAVSDAATLDRVPLAAGEASDLAVTAAALDRPPGLYTTEDLLLPWALQGAPARRGRLAALVAPLAEHADLILTLQTYLAVDGDGGAAAARLHVHRNTLAYRLRRIRALTGLAPTSLTDAQVLAAALTSRRLEEYDASVPLSVALDLTS